MYPFPKHQTELFIFDNYLVHNIETIEEVQNSLYWKFDFKKSQDDTLSFAVLGMYKIAVYNDCTKKTRSINLLTF